MIQILVCEDDRNIRRLISEYLLRAGYGVTECADGEEALKIIRSQPMDLLVTDIMMPRMDGFDLAGYLRSSGSEMPILMITAKDTIQDKRTGFSQGADDYMVKPIDMDEMLIRVGALLRRARLIHDQKLMVGSTVLDARDLSVSVAGETTFLPRKEFLLIYKLLSQPNQIFTRRQLMDEIWGFDAESDERTVDVHMRRLREKLEPSADFELITVRGLGYKAVHSSC